ncbi:biotin--[acetyl-CoA-carboxylase] ligase [Hydrogenimonas thermophila]|uniref:BirA family transcriptional regulator, biotin operon repressor / biotin-[acetyl-CoA-carboxylase] ligase n=1 Tax=Hydrogenimonas thermophila TaxID=223786 RepID=A0A1I5SHN1_9BACT|nr:biotin--[acetyl-CoA-carboxylase] ligase [Hydrogenimonas thermophila]SFP70245.1 BirA family transcriptional regulator, biotin operon repressor / biotin-[acetyl-CoA-carboxylase] ligase [Hydrogenimonas thermophila]
MLKIYSFEILPSTQKWLIEKVQDSSVEIPCAVITEMQTDGIGSRNNSWIGNRGNFFASVAILEEHLPDDLPITATSIYFACLMKNSLENFGSKVWVKWPNDLYIESSKVGGCITVKKGGVMIVGIGVNIIKAPLGFGVLDIVISPDKLLKEFLERVKRAPSWKQIFSNFRLEFEKSKEFYTHIENEKFNLTDAILNDDGSLMIGKRRVVSLR